jgi:S1-C subfamily serine protease
MPAQESQSFSPFGEPESEGGGTATGSGFVIDSEGRVLTNNHVVEGADQIQVKLGASDATYDAKVVGTDPASDLALLEVDAPADQLHPLTLGHSSEMEVGDPVVAIGNPFGLDRTVTSGIVSALQRQIQAPNGFSISNVIQTDAAINPGNSGGPLINAEGEVIGINSQIETGGGSSGNVGIGFAIPIDIARAEIHQLVTNGEVEHAFLGISGGTITPDLAKAINLPVSEGVIVQSVVKGGPADKAGIEGGDTSATIEGAEVSLGGDIITEVNGKKVSGMDEIVNLVNAAKPGDTLELTILRGGTTKTATVTLGDRPNSVEEGSEGG